MKPYFVMIASASTLVITSVVGKMPDKLSAEWEITGDSPKSYEAGIDHTVAGGKGDAKFLRFVEGNSVSWAVLLQSISAKEYRGQRVRYQARLKTRDVDQYWAGIFFQVLAANGRTAIIYDGRNAPMKGDNEWQVRSVVFDIPEDAGTISFGVRDGGRGQVWAEGMKFEIVGKDVPVSQQNSVSAPLKKTPSL
jgi:hypothetical protein